MILEKRTVSRKLTKALGMLCAFGLLIVFMMTPSYTSEGTYDGIQLCLNIAVPSLFPMMFAAMLVIETGLAQSIGDRLSFITTRLFALPGAAGTAVLLAVIGGFPAGAKAVCELYSRGVVEKKNAERMLLFCFSAGPAFLLGTVGGLYSSISVGIILMIVQIISILIIGFITRFLPQNDQENTIITSEHNFHKSTKNLASAITSSARKTSSAMLNICLFIIIFNIIRSIIDNCGISAAVVRLLTSFGVEKTAAEAVIPIILEVTSGCIYASDVGIPATAFAVGFGGLAVHMQILALCDKLEINYPLFFVLRLMQGFVCSILSFIIIKIFPGDVMAAANFHQIKPSFSTAPTGAVMLILMSLMCVLCIPETEY